MPSAPTSASSLVCIPEMYIFNSFNFLHFHCQPSVSHVSQLNYHFPVRPLQPVFLTCLQFILHTVAIKLFNNLKSYCAIHLSLDFLAASHRTWKTVSFTVVSSLQTSLTSALSLPLIHYLSISHNSWISTSQTRWAVFCCRILLMLFCLFVFRNDRQTCLPLRWQRPSHLSWTLMNQNGRLAVNGNDRVGCALANASPAWTLYPFSSRVIFFPIFQVSAQKLPPQRGIPYFSV